jgi:hypothetical protein
MFQIEMHIRILVSPGAIDMSIGIEQVLSIFVYARQLLHSSRAKDSAHFNSLTDVVVELYRNYGKQYPPPPRCRYADVTLF